MSIESYSFFIFIMQTTNMNYRNIKTLPEIQEILLDKVCIKYFFGVLLPIF